MAATKTVALEQVSFARLLFALLRSRFTGALMLEQPAPRPGRRQVWLRGGMPVYTDWVADEDRLGRVLVAAKLTPVDVVEAAASLPPDGTAIGARLVAGGALSPDALAQALGQQAERKLVHPFGLRSGLVELHAGASEPAHVAELPPANALALIAAGVRRHYDEGRIREEMGAAFDGPLHATAALAKYRAHFGFAADDGEVLQALATGVANFGALLDQVALGPRHVAQLVFVLWACQMLQATAATAAAAAGPDAAGSSATGAAGARGAAKPEAPRPPAAAGARPPPPPPAPTARAAAAPSGAAAPARAGGSGPAAAATPLPAPAAATAPARPAEDRAGFEARLRELEAKVQAEANAFELLQLGLDADKRAIRRAWGDLSRDWHPDGLKSRGLEEFSERVQRVFAALSEAHMVLGDDAKRDDLKQLIALGGSQKVKANANAAQLAREALRAEVIAREGDKLLKAGRIPRALEKFREAIALNPGDPDTETAIVWCEYLSGPAERATAKAALAKVDKTIEEYPNLARAHFVRGMLLVAIDSPRLAIAAFEEAQRLDPRDVEAQRQARVAKVKLDVSRADKKKDKGLFSGIFGSGKR